MPKLSAKQMGLIVAAAAAIGLPLTIKSEGVVNKVYIDKTAGISVPTVCAGHRVYGNYDANRVYSEAECQIMAMQDLGEYIEYVVTVTDPILDEHMYAGLGDFTLNLGKSTYQKSSVRRLLNEGKYHDACDAILLYKYVNRVDCFDDKNKRACGGIKQRRFAERDLCVKGADIMTKPPEKNKFKVFLRKLFKKEPA